jgi:hypothetical protein
MTADPPVRGGVGHTRGYGRRLAKKRASPLGAAPREEEAVPMISTVPSAEARELHRSQRALVAASLIACPPGVKRKRS